MSENKDFCRIELARLKTLKRGGEVSS